MAEPVIPSRRTASGRIGRWRSEAGRRAYLASYARAMALLPVPARTLDIPTGYGTVRMYAFGPVTHNQAPVVLLAGRTSGAPMWFANITDLAAQRTVYALDTLGDAGLSVQTRPLRDGGDHAAWLDDVIVATGSSTVHLVGHSFGGSLATTYALAHPNRVASLSLIEPVLVLQGLRWQIYWHATVASLPFVSRRWRDRALAALGGSDDVDPNDPVARMVADGAAQFVAALPFPHRPSNRELARLKLPVYLALAENSPMHDARAAADVARAALPAVRVALWPGTTHSLPMEVPAPLDAELLAFMATHDRDGSA